MYQPESIETSTVPNTQSYTLDSIGFEMEENFNSDGGDEHNENSSDTNSRDKQESTETSNSSELSLSAITDELNSIENLILFLNNNYK